MTNAFANLFHDKNEELKGVLGQGYVSLVFVQNSFSKSVMVLTNKRLYQKGRLF